MESARRNFLTKFAMRRAAKLVSEVCEAYQQGASEAAYFDSYTTSYPLISEYAYFIEDETKSLGIDTANKSDAEIAETVYAKTRRSE
jgi:hypothetical protein